MVYDLIDAFIRRFGKAILLQSCATGLLKVAAALAVTRDRIIIMVL